MSRENVERLRAGYAAFNRGEFEAIFELLDSGFTVRDRDEIPDPRTYEGLEGAMEAFVGASGDFEDYSIEPVEVEDGEDWVLVRARQRGRGKLSGALVEGDVFHLWRLRDGKAVGLSAFSTREDALAAAGAAGAG